MTATRSQLDTALRLAELEYVPFPTVRGQKRPRTEHGHLEATRDRQTITQWWVIHPDDNLGISLKASGLLVVAPDCEARHEDFKRRGLPETMVVQTGSGAGHLHYYYRLPEGGPHLRICRSGDYDIMSDGYVLGPGSRTTGEYIIVTEARAVSDLPEAPAWAVAMLRNAKERETVSLPVVNVDEPPVRLSPDALRWWTGEKQAGNRSDTLFGIAKDLYRAGATLSTIAAALANRDVALNFSDGPKYAGRSDAATRYLETARKAAARVEQEQAFAETITQATPNSNVDDSPCQMQVMRLQAQVDQLKAEIAALRGHHSVTERVHNNPGLTPAQGQVATNVVAEVASKMTTGQAVDGWALIRLDAIVKTAESKDPETGEVDVQRVVSKQTASRYIDRLEEAGIWEVREEPRYNGGSPITDKYIRLVSEPTETLEKLATIVLEKPKQGGSTKGHRGCKKHPNAGVNVSRVTRCSICRDVLDEEHIKYVPAARFQDGIVEESLDTVDVPMGVRMEPLGQSETPFQHETDEHDAKVERMRALREARPAQRFQHETAASVPLQDRVLDVIASAHAAKQPIKEEDVARVLGADRRAVKPILSFLVNYGHVRRHRDGVLLMPRPPIAIGAD